jgi:hypothetical protein
VVGGWGSVCEGVGEGVRRWESVSKGMGEAWVMGERVQGDERAAWMEKGCSRREEGQSQGARKRGC